MPDPLWIDADAGAPSYDARELRRAFSTIFMRDTSGAGQNFMARQGVHPSMLGGVSLVGTTITVFATKGVISPGLNGLQGPYIVQLPQETHTLTAADGSNPRKDIVILRVYDNTEDLSGLRLAQSEYIVGTPAASPVEPAVPAGSFKLATIDVPAGGSPAATVTYNAPYTVAAGGILPVRSSAEYPANAKYDGLAVWDATLDALVVWTDGAWKTVASTAVQPGTIVGYFRRTTAVSLTNTTSSATATAIPWNLGALDKLSAWNSGVNPTRYTPTVPGWYMFDGMVSFTAATGGTLRGAAWRKNGAAFDGNISRAHVFPTGTGPGVTVTATATPYAASMNGTTDYVELAGLQDSGAALDTATGGFDCVMTVTYGGPL